MYIIFNFVGGATFYICASRALFLSAILQLRRVLSTTVEPTAGSVCTPREEGPGQKGVVGDSVAGPGAPCPATGEEAGVENGVGSCS